ncbi:MAG: Gfo/Idh/MocA family oxidoreductase [Anaerolineaceae bacterium]|nr:Gfo/Idh/MocA family oxidoreductase [Anaerolineaceae bacterium]
MPDQSDSSRIRIAVMGCASIAQRSVIPAIKELKEQFDLVAVASRSEEKANAFADEFDCEAVVGYENLLARNDVDAVYIPLPTGLHEEWVLKALAAGKHVLVEKSAAVNLTSALKMVQAAREHHLLLMEDFMFLYHSQHQFVRNLVESDQIGQLRVMRSSFGFPPLNHDNFRYVKELGGGALYDAGTYTLRATQWYLGTDIQVFGASRQMDAASGVDIAGSADLWNGDGVVSQVAFGFDHFYQCNYELWGSKGKIVVERAFTPPPSYSPKVVLERQGEREVFQLPPDHHFRNMLVEFARGVREEGYALHWEALLDQAKLLQQVIDFRRVGGVNAAGE